MSQSHQETSKEARASIVEDSAKVRRNVFIALRTRGSHGATCDELEAQFRFRHQTASARLRELFLMGRIRDSGQRRLTRSRRRAIVWTVA